MRDAMKDGWIRRVLGVALPEPDQGESDLGSTINRWRGAMEEVDRQISALQTALRETEEDDLRDIAELGLNALTGGFKVRMMASVMAVARTNVPQERTKLGAIAAAFRDHLQKDARVAACDDNPFGVSMSIRATLVPALDAMVKQLGG